MGKNNSFSLINKKPRRPLRPTVPGNSGESNPKLLPPVDSIDLSGLEDKIDNLLDNILQKKIPVGKQVTITQDLYDEVLLSLKSAVIDVYKQAISDALSPAVEKIEMQNERLDLIDQNYRAMNLCIHGLPETDNEITSEVVKQFCNDKLNIDLGPTGLARARRIGRKKPMSNRNTLPTEGNSPMEESISIEKGKKLRQKHRVVLVTFAQYDIRAMVFAAKRNLKGSGYLLTEDLTPSRKELYMVALGHYGVRQVWSQDGMIKIFQNGTIKTVTSRKQLERLLCQNSCKKEEDEEFTTPPSMQSPK